MNWWNKLSDYFARRELRKRRLAILEKELLKYRRGMEKETGDFWSYVYCSLKIEKIEKEIAKIKTSG